VIAAGKDLCGLQRLAGLRNGPLTVVQWRCGGVANVDIRAIAKRHPAGRLPRTAVERGLASMAQILLPLIIVIDAARAAVVSSAGPRQGPCLFDCEQVPLTSNPGYIL
jgi:hypothetical protein